MLTPRYNLHQPRNSTWSASHIVLVTSMLCAARLEKEICQNMCQHKDSKNCECQFKSFLIALIKPHVFGIFLLFALRWNTINAKASDSLLRQLKQELSSYRKKEAFNARKLWQLPPCPNWSPLRCITFAFAKRCLGWMPCCPVALLKTYGKKNPNDPSTPPLCPAS